MNYFNSRQTQQSVITDCYFLTKPDAPPLFTFHPNNELSVYLNKMAIIPLDEYERLKELAGEHKNGMTNKQEDTTITDYERAFAPFK